MRAVKALPNLIAPSDEGAVAALAVTEGETGEAGINSYSNLKYSILYYVSTTVFFFLLFLFV